MQSYVHVLTSRSSSASLFLARQQSYLTDGALDDMDIAQALLNHPTRNPTHHKSSFSIAKPLDFSDNLLNRHRTWRPTSNNLTWTSSSCEIMSEHGDNVEERTQFIEEYNLLAGKHHVQLLISKHETESIENSAKSSRKHGNWFTRKILRRTSSNFDFQSSKNKSKLQVRPRRSISDISLRGKPIKDGLKGKDLPELVRLCGLSILELPPEYSPGSLRLPTCFRATGQKLLEEGPITGGIFRVPGAQNTITDLYNHYCPRNEDEDSISGTVRSTTLPEHIECDIHDVASTFKKFLSGLPGGVLGSLQLFGVLVSIQNKLQKATETTKTQETKVCVRLIALAISATRSQYRHDLICVVFGLLSLIGSAAEIAPKEDETGRPLPTRDLMKYGPLGVVFGPLLVGDLLVQYTLPPEIPTANTVLSQLNPPKLRKDKMKKSKSMANGANFTEQMDKVKIANDVIKMVIAHWPDIIRQIKGICLLNTNSLPSQRTVPVLRPSASESFISRRSIDWDNDDHPAKLDHQHAVPVPKIPRHISQSNLQSPHYGYGRHGFSSPNSGHQNRLNQLNVQKHRERAKIPSINQISNPKSLITLSPTVEESSPDIRVSQSDRAIAHAATPTRLSTRSARDHVLSRSETSSLGNPPRALNYIPGPLNQNPFVPLPVINSGSPLSTSKNLATNKSANQESKLRRQDRSISNALNTKENHPGQAPMSQKVFEESQNLPTSHTQLDPQVKLNRDLPAANFQRQGYNETRRQGGSEPNPLQRVQVFGSIDRRGASRTHDISQPFQSSAPPRFTRSNTRAALNTVQPGDDLVSVTDPANSGFPRSMTRVALNPPRREDDLVSLTGLVPSGFTRSRTRVSLIPVPHRDELVSLTDSATTPNRTERLDSNSSFNTRKNRSPPNDEADNASNSSTTYPASLRRYRNEGRQPTPKSPNRSASGESAGGSDITAESNFSSRRSAGNGQGDGSSNERQGNRAVVRREMYRQQSMAQLPNENRFDISSTGIYLQQDSTHAVSTNDLSKLIHDAQDQNSSRISHEDGYVENMHYSQERPGRPRRPRIEEYDPRFTAIARPRNQNFQPQRAASGQNSQQQVNQDSRRMPLDAFTYRRNSPVRTSYSSASSMVSEIENEGIIYLSTNHVSSTLNRINELQSLGRSGSVKALAAKFNNAVSSSTILSPEKLVRDSTPQIRGIIPYTRYNSAFPLPSPTASPSSLKSTRSRISAPPQTTRNEASFTPRYPVDSRIARRGTFTIQASYPVDPSSPLPRHRSALFKQLPSGLFGSSPSPSTPKPPSTRNGALSTLATLQQDRSSVYSTTSLSRLRLDLIKPYPVSLFRRNHTLSDLSPSNPQSLPQKMAESDRPSLKSVDSAARVISGGDNATQNNSSGLSQDRSSASTSDRNSDDQLLAIQLSAPTCFRNFATQYEEACTLIHDHYALILASANDPESRHEAQVEMWKLLAETGERIIVHRQNEEDFWRGRLQALAQRVNEAGTRTPLRLRSSSTSPGFANSLNGRNGNEASF